MGMGVIDESVLGDIANAIREQNGSSATYKPADMAAAVTALDGTKSGDAATLAPGDGTGDTRPHVGHRPQAARDPLQRQ